jgi:aerobic-type carbon monoxide dehydrogenase small subunit (CoxS/CutS family)
MKSVFRLRINGAAVEVLALVHKTLLEVLCEDLQLTGTKHGRELGECGTCTVLLDGVPTLLCLLLPIEVQEHEIVTIEGMALGSTLHALQNTFSELGAAQWGYCTPGMLLTALALLCTNPAPARQQIKEALAGNLCRCTGYIKIFEAVDLAAQRLLADCIPSAGEAMASTYSIIGQRVPARVDGTGKNQLPPAERVV